MAKVKLFQGISTIIIEKDINKFIDENDIELIGSPVITSSERCNNEYSILTIMLIYDYKISEAE